MVAVSLAPQLNTFLLSLDYRSLVTKCSKRDVLGARKEMSK
jgi:hypothetical protein